MSDPRANDPTGAEAEVSDEEAAEAAGANPAADAASEAVNSEVGAAPEISAEASGDSQLAEVMAERDDYLDRLRRLQADFENFRKRVAKDHEEASERGAARLIDQLLPVLDSCDAALMHGADGVEPIFAALLGALEKEGLERIDPLDQPFDPELHEAVLHEHGDDDSGPVVVEVLRPGYVWKSKVIRAAMVKVKG